MTLIMLLGLGEIRENSRNEMRPAAQRHPSPKEKERG